MLERQYSINFAKETIRLFQESIRKKKIRFKGRLEESFTYEIQNFAGGNVTKIKILYEYYGRFVNLGVGRGQSLDAVKDNSTLNQLAGKKGRRAKRWKDQIWREQRQKFYGHVFLEMRKRTRAALKINPEGGPQKITMNL